MAYDLPLHPASSGVTIYDSSGRLLIVKPTYKKGWSIPGGQMEAGESPWETACRETLEEVGLTVSAGRLIAVDFRPDEKGMRFLFNCGRMSKRVLKAIRLQESELEDHRFVSLDEAAELLRGPVSRRVTASAGAKRCVYLHDGKLVQEVR